MKHAEDLEEFSNFDFTENVEALKIETVRIGGSIQEFRLHFDRKNNQMAFSNWNALAGKLKYSFLVQCLTSTKTLDNDEIIFVSGRPTDTSDFSDLKIIADEIVALDKARDYYAKHVNIKFEPDEMIPDDVDAIYALAQKYHGSSGLLFHIAVNGEKINESCP